MKPTLWPFMALVLVLSFSCSTDAIEEDKADAIVAKYVPETKMVEVEILDLINQHRESLDLTKLTSMSTIKAVAYGHTDYMIRTKDVSHANFNQRWISLRDEVGAVDASENVAYAYSTPQSVVNAWLNSEAHRENIEGNFTHFDISAEQDDDGKWYYTNIFVKK